MYSHKRTSLYVSVLSSAGLEGDGVHVLCITVVSTPKSSTIAAHPHLWDASAVEIVSTTKVEGRVKGQEASLWALDIDPNHYYHVVVHTVRRGLEGMLSHAFNCIFPCCNIADLLAYLFMFECY